MTTHNLKCDPAPFEAIKAGLKTFEIRENDRLFQAGDTVILTRNPTLEEIALGTYGALGRAGSGGASVGGPRKLPETLVRRIKWVQPGGRYGLGINHVALSLEASKETVGESEPQTDQKSPVNSEPQTAQPPEIETLAADFSSPPMRELCVALRYAGVPMTVLPDAAKTARSLITAAVVKALGGVNSEAVKYCVNDSRSNWKWAIPLSKLESMIRDAQAAHKS